MLIELARAEGIPGVEFGGHAEMDEPIILQRFVEIGWGVGWDMATDLGDFFQLRASAADWTPPQPVSAANSAYLSPKRINAPAAMCMARNSSCLS